VRTESYPTKTTDVYVCYPSSLTCIGGGSSSGGNIGGSSGGFGSSSGGGGPSSLCSLCDSINCSGTNSQCACDPEDSSCEDGFCVSNCEQGNAADQALCPKGTTCVATIDYETESLSWYGCYPAGGSCIDAGF
jgi:hypothetical protein